MHNDHDLLIKIATRQEQVSDSFIRGTLRMDNLQKQIDRLEEKIDAQDKEINKRITKEHIHINNKLRDFDMWRAKLLGAAAVIAAIIGWLMKKF